MKAGARVQYAIVAEDAVIEENAVVGARPEEHSDDWGVAVIAAGVTVGAGATVPPRAMVEEDVEGGAIYAK